MYILIEEIRVHQLSILKTEIRVHQLSILKTKSEEIRVHQLSILKTKIRGNQSTPAVYSEKENPKYKCRLSLDRFHYLNINYF